MQKHTKAQKLDAGRWGKWQRQTGSRGVREQTDGPGSRPGGREATLEAQDQGDDGLTVSSDLGRSDGVAVMSGGRWARFWARGRGCSTVW